MTKLSAFLNVTWREIEEAERYGERSMSFELDDIFERARLYGHELDRVIEENIEYILKKRVSTSLARCT